MFLNIKQGRLIATFRYDPNVVEVIRSITGRAYNSKLRHWVFPAGNAEECVIKLEPLGFAINNSVRVLVEQNKRSLLAVENLKKDPAQYAGNLPLYDFQRIGSAFLTALPSALLADVPGLGKTIQTIAALESFPKILVFCPATLKYNWEEEIKKWVSNASIQVINGKKDERVSQWRQAENYKWTIANYELLIHDPEEIKKQSWEVIVCDEANRIANPFSKTVRTLKTIPAAKRIALTGTPVSNSPLDIYSIIDWLSPKFLGHYNQFIDRYCIMDPVYFRPIGYKNLEELAGRASRFILRRTKEEVLTDFPEKTIENISFELSDKEKDFYTAIKKELIRDLGELEVSSDTLAFVPVKMLRLKQATDHLNLISSYHESTKLQTLKDLLEPIAKSGEKCLIFTQFAEMAKILASELFKYNPRLIYGEIPVDERIQAVHAFTENKDCSVMIMTEAGAYGLNLQAASYVFHYDAPWSVAKLTQREDRAHRLGQTKPVTIYNLIAKNTIDEYVAKVLHKKQKAAVDILADESRMFEAGIDMDDIKAILRI